MLGLFSLLFWAPAASCGRGTSSPASRRAKGGRVLCELVAVATDLVHLPREAAGARVRGGTPPASTLLAGELLHLPHEAAGVGGAPRPPSPGTNGKDIKARLDRRPVMFAHFFRVALLA